MFGHGFNICLLKYSNGVEICFTYAFNQFLFQKYYVVVCYLTSYFDSNLLKMSKYIKVD